MGQAQKSNILFMFFHVGIASIHCVRQAGAGGWSWSSVREKYYWAGWSWRLELEWCERKILFGCSWSNKPNAVCICVVVICWRSCGALNFGGTHNKCTSPHHGSLPPVGEISKHPLHCQPVTATATATEEVTSELVGFSFSGLFQLVLVYFFSHGTIKSAEISRLLNQPNSPRACRTWWSITLET